MISMDGFYTFYYGCWMKSVQIIWPFQKARGLFIFSYLVSVLAGSALISLTIWHTWLVLTAQTTIEFYRNQVARNILGEDFVNQVTCDFLNI